MGVDFKLRASSLEWQHRANPSLVRKLLDALRAVERGLTVLASAGHPMHLEDGAMVPSSWPWPKTYYHWDHGHREVMGPEHLRELGPGWYDSPSAMEQAHGEDVQFAGRGGVQRHRALALMNGAGAVAPPPLGPTKADLIAQFRAGRVRGQGG